MRLGHRSRLERLPPLAHPPFDLLAPAAAGLLLQHRQEQPQRLGRAAVEVHFAGIAQRQHRRVDVDLHARRACLGQELGPRESRCRRSARCRSRSSCPSWAWFRAGRSQPVTNGRSSGRTDLPSNALATPAPSFSATAMTSSAAPAAPAPIRIATLLAGIEDVRGLAQVGFRGHDHRTRIARTRARVAVRALGCFEGLLLHVLGKDDCAGPAARDRQPDRAVDDVRKLRRSRDLLHIFGDVREHTVEIELLLIACAADGRRPWPQMASTGIWSSVAS